MFSVIQLCIHIHQTISGTNACRPKTPSSILEGWNMIEVEWQHVA